MRCSKFLRFMIIVLATLLMTVAFSACDFFSYETGTTAEQLEYQTQLSQKQEQYIAALNGLSSEDAYFEAERKVYVRCLREGVNRIRDCEKIELLDGIFEERKEAILSIKTIADYEEEERVKSEQLANAKAECLAKLNALSSEDNYREAELTVYRFYLGAAADEINACESVDFLNDIFDTYRDVIESIKTAAEYEAEEAAEFALFCDSKKQEIRNYVALADYRKEEAERLTAYIAEYEIKIGEAADYDAVENAVREFKIKVYPIKTDAELYAEELAEAIRNAIVEIDDYVNLIDYRANEAEIVKAVIDAFNEQIVGSQKKEEVSALISAYKGMLDSVKTDAELYEDEKLQIIEEGYTELLGVVDLEHASEEWAASYREYCDRVKSELIALKTKEEVLSRLSDEKKVAYLAGAQTNDPHALKKYQEILVSDIVNYKDMTLYREEQRKEILSIRSSFTLSVASVFTYDETMALYDSTLSELDGVPTNDDMWDIEDEQFRTRLRELYGSEILEEPRSLSEANSYYELADIIDYYAFYQLDGNSFVRDRFRVKLNFSHKDAMTEITTVYWYCELIRTAVGITGEIENKDYLIVELMPYNFASVSNEKPTLNRLNNPVEYDSDQSTMTVRESDFDNFAYYKYKKTIRVWNTQQLWYALEHEYVPICEPASVAEKALNRAKEILREIIKEGMTDEEKVFRIYKWFGEVGQDDDNYGVALSNDEKVAQLRSFHVEGILFDRLGVCYSCAKLNLLLLRIEGIEAFYSFCAIQNNVMGYAPPIYAGHAYNYIHINGNWYMGDALRSFYASPNHGDGVSYNYLLLPAYGIYSDYTGGQMKVNSDLWDRINEECSNDWSIYSKLKIQDVTLYLESDTYQETIDRLLEYNLDSFSFFCRDDIKQLALDYLIEKGNYDIYQICYNKQLWEGYCYHNNPQE